MQSGMGEQDPSGHVPPAQYPSDPQQTKSVGAPPQHVSVETVRSSLADRVAGPPAKDESRRHADIDPHRARARGSRANNDKCAGNRGTEPGADWMVLQDDSRACSEFPFCPIRNLLSTR